MNGRNLLLVVGSMVAVGLLLVGFATTQPAEPTPMPTHAAYAVGYQIPTPTPTIPSVVGQPASWFWYQLPADVQKAILNQMNRVPPPAPSDLIGFEVGPKGCRWTIEGNATEQGSDSLAGDCGELLRILNPVPPAPIVAPMPTATPESPNPSYYQNDLYDPRPRDGKYTRVRTYLNYGSQVVNVMRETEPGSFLWAEAFVMTTSTPESGAYTYITRQGDDYGVGVDYFDGDIVQHDNFLLDEIFPLDVPAQPEPEPTATPTPTPEPEPVYQTIYAWVAGTNGMTIVLSATPGNRPGTSVLSIIGFYNGYLRQDEWFLTVPVYEFKSARIGPDGYVYFFFSTVPGGELIENRRLPWWLESGK